MSTDAGYRSRRGDGQARQGAARPAPPPLLQRVSVVYWTTDAQLRITANSAMDWGEPGVREGELVGVALESMFSEGADAPAVRAHGSALRGRSARAEVEWRGRIFDIDVQPLRDSGGVVTGVLGIAQDTTERVIAERELQEREALHNAILGTARDVIYTLDCSGAVTSLNPAFETVTGWACEDWVGKIIAPLIHPDDVSRAMEMIRHGRETGAEGPLVELRMRTKSGDWIDAEIASRPLFKNGEVVGSVGIARDVTERKRAEARLRETERRLQFTLANSPVIVWAQDRALRYVWAHNTVKGDEFPDIIGKKDEDLMLPDEVPALTRVKRRALRTGERQRAEVKASPLGYPQYFDMMVEPARDETGKVTGITCIAVDVTGRREREARQQKLAEASVRINASLSVSETMQITTDTARDVIGTEMAGSSLTTGPDMAQDILAVSLSDKYAAWRDYNASPRGKGIYRLICETNRSLRLTHEEMLAHPAWRGYGDEAGKHPKLRGLLGAPLVGRDGRNLGVVLVSDKCNGDFTEEDEAVLVQLAQMASVAIENASLFEEVARAEERHQRVLDAASDVIFTLTSDAKFESLSSAFERLTGWKCGEWVGKGFVSLLHPDDLLRILKLREEMIRTRRAPERYEVRIRTRGGGYRVAEILSRPVFEGGEYVGSLGIARDVTEKKHREEALQEAKDRLQMSMTAARLGTWSWDLRTGDVLWSANMEELHGLTHGTFKGNITSFLWIASSDDWPAVERAMMEAVAGDGKFDFEYRVMGHDGKRRWLRSTGHVQFDETGKPVLISGVSMDVTEPVLMQQELEAVREKLESRAERTLQAKRVNTYGLTFRELTVLQLMAEGKADKEIAFLLGISVPTAHKHVGNILERMGAASRTEASVRAVTEGVIDTPGAKA